MHTTISSHAKGGFDGVLLIGDVHSDFGAFSNAAKYASDHNYFLLSLGDLVDGQGGSPFEVVEAMHSLMLSGKCGVTIGNHDDKMYRYAHGRKVRFSHDALNTLDLVGNRLDEFLSYYAGLIDSSVGGIFHTFDDIIVAHAAYHPAMCDNPNIIGDTARHRALYGETEGHYDADGWVIRTYEWTKTVPAGKTMIVGHDRNPMLGGKLEAPLEVINEDGGKTIFIDTSCGKGGYLSGVVLKHDINWQVSHYKDFR